MNVYEDIIERSPLAMAIAKGETHELRQVNAPFNGLYGKRTDDLVGRPFAEAIPGSEEDGVVSLLDRVANNGGSETIENIGHTDPGNSTVYRSYTVWNISSVLGEAPSLLIHVVDSTEQVISNRHSDSLNEEMREINERLILTSLQLRERAEAAATAETRLRDLLQGLGAVIYEIDVASSELTFVSQQAEAFLGYPVERFGDMEFWSEIVHPRDFQDISSFSRRSLKEGRDYEYEFRAVTAHGSTAWLRNTVRLVRSGKGEVTTLRGVIVDITGQRQAEQAYERQRRIAEALQRTILQEVPENAFPGLAVATLYEPALNEAMIGGDFFDAFLLPNGAVMLVVGDVTGKGLEAAARTAEVKFALRAFAQDYPEPAEAAAHLNDFICNFHAPSENDGHALIVMSIMDIDPATGRAIFTTAGAEPPSIIRASGTVEQVTSTGLILGVEPGTVYHQGEFSLESGDLVIMATDGITEARNKSDFYGRERMEQAAHASRLGPLHDIAQSIQDEARTFSGGSFQDDVCLLIARWG